MNTGPNSTPAEFREMAMKALDVVESFYRELPDAPIMPDTTAQAIRKLITEALPSGGVPFETALAAVRDVIYPLNRHNGHSRMFGYVASPGTAVVAIGDLLASALNANVTAWRSAPAAVEIEHLVIDWFKSALGYPSDAAGLLVSGGSMANFAALAAARTAAASDFARTGRTAKPLRMYVSEEAHFSMHKAARLLGYGSENVRTVGVDDQFRMDVSDLERRICRDVEAGFQPACVVGSAGTVNTGAFDPLAAIADIAERHGLWMHVDGAYGAFSALASAAKPLFAGIDRADSVSLDPHKWLYGSMGCGCVLYRKPGTARATFAHDADYTRPVGFTRDEAFAFWDYGPELSRPFRALPLWLQLKVFGADAIGAAIQRNIECARYVGRMIETSSDFELLAPVGLSIFCFRYRPSGYDGDLDALNEWILLALQRAGSSYVSNTRIRGRFALRGCVLNYRTTEADMERLLEDVRRAAAAS
jgi:glutamate/tyrosine decarboxylase-like PLP-dependent enzyme